jgi:glycosyltransferase involved in cell wall biosynthesis
MTANPDTDADAQAGTAAIVFAVVLFQTRWADSATLRSLDASLRALPEFDWRVLLFDNSGPGYASPLALADSGRLEVHVCDANLGLAVAYNRALAYARERGARCLVTLDQDSQVTPDYLRALVAAQPRLSGRTAALCPTVVSGGRVVSPFRFNGIGLPRYGAQSGSQSGALSAINSFSAYAVDYLAAHGGFDEFYWLDGLDFAVYARIHRAGYRAEPLACTVTHALSLVGGQVSQARMVNLMRYEAAFLFEYCRVPQIVGGCARLLVRALRPRRHGLPTAAVMPVLRSVLAGAAQGWQRRADASKKGDMRCA